MQEKGVAARLEALFKLLDAAEVTPAAVLNSAARKEYYESLLMFAFRRLQGARYHSARVDDLLAASASELSGCAIDPAEHGGLKITEVVVKTSKLAGEFGFELSAFFDAVRSAFDFITRVCIFHMKGMQHADSIKTLLNAVDAGKTGPLLEVVAKHSVWLKHVRSYRDELVHRLVLNTVSGGQNTWKQGIAQTTPYPVVVPSETPKHISDTRLARMMDEPEHRFSVMESHATVTYSDQSSKIIEHKIEFSAGPGYMRIEELMKRELDGFESFFDDLAQALIKLNFQPAPVLTPHT